MTISLTEGNFLTPSPKISVLTMYVNEFINTKNGIDGSVQNIPVVAKSSKTKK